MSVCGSIDTPVPEMGREMVVIWGIKSGRIGARATAEGGVSLNLVGQSMAVMLPR